MHLRKGRTKTLIESSIDCALLSVEIYNKPRAPFRVEAFITQMVMAWTRLLQAHFNAIGEKYFYKEKNGRFKMVDGEKKSWELKTCISRYPDLTEAVRVNLEFFIKLRNKIEHHIINREEIGIMIFGECQSLLYNYENELIKLFGEEYAVNESLAYSLQFSRIRTAKQNEANKQILSTEVKEIKDFIEKYRQVIKEDVFNTQEYSIKLIQVPKIVNTNRNDVAIEFVNWNSLSEEDKESYKKVTALIKDKVVKTEAINPGKLKPGRVLLEVNKQIQSKINHHDHKCILAIFKIRPYKEFNIKEYDPFETNTTYCHYDEAHKDYLYKQEWVDLLASAIKSNKLTQDQWRGHFEKRTTIDIKTIDPEKA